jgi:hypothetical protein
MEGRPPGRPLTELEAPERVPSSRKNLRTGEFSLSFFFVRSSQPSFFNSHSTAETRIGNKTAEVNLTAGCFAAIFASLAFG